MKLLVTGGTVFVSKCIAEYFAADNAVYVLNRNTKSQAEGVNLIEADRDSLDGILDGVTFDAVVDVTAYTGNDIENLLKSGVKFSDYIMISSSAVYPEYAAQPFLEDGEKARNVFWGDYGTNKIQAEAVLLDAVPKAYILRPPYLYGPHNNVYREAFVFDCAMKKRKFYLPGNGGMKMQFFHVGDLCRFIEILLEKKPGQNIYNVGNPESVSIKAWVQHCYHAVGEEPEFVQTGKGIPQRNYFPFADYEYSLDVTRQQELMEGTKDLEEGLRESYEWYKDNMQQVNRKDYIGYIDGICSK